LNERRNDEEFPVVFDDNSKKKLCGSLNIIMHFEEDETIRQPKYFIILKVPFIDENLIAIKEKTFVNRRLLNKLNDSFSLLRV
jgi:hypothetical protein